MVRLSIDLAFNGCLIVRLKNSQIVKSSVHHYLLFAKLRTVGYINLQSAVFPMSKKSHVSKKSNALVWLVLIILVLAGGYFFVVKPKMMSEQGQEMETVRVAEVLVPLAGQNNSLQAGSASLVENVEGKVVVTLNLSGGNFTMPQPAHIHLGVCPKPGAVKYPLTDVIDGQSVTTLPVSLTELKADGAAMAINIHKSAAEVSTYTACGDLAF